MRLRGCECAFDAIMCMFHFRMDVIASERKEEIPLYV